jgi:hypothetical protein
MQTARYTAENATKTLVRPAYVPEHYNADAEGFVTFVSLSWGADFIGTSLPGTPLPSEALRLAAAEMEQGYQKSLRLQPRIEQIMQETGCSFEDAWDRAEDEDDHNLIPFVSGATWTTIGFDLDDADLLGQEIR